MGIAIEPDTIDYSSSSYRDRLSSTNERKRPGELLGYGLSVMDVEFAFPAMELDIDHLRYIVEHVFLPPKLPQSYDPDGEFKDESLYWFIAWSAQQFVNAMHQSKIPASFRDVQYWNKVVKALNYVAKIHSQHRLLKEDIEMALGDMEVGG